MTLKSLRLRLTAWYAATLLLILGSLGTGLFLVIRSQLSQQLDDSLQSATSELIRAARIREMEARSARGKVVDAVDELRIPDRTLYLLDDRGTPIKPAAADDWIRQAAVGAARAGSANATHPTDDDVGLRLHAARFRLDGGATLVAIAVADDADLDERYASLIAVFSAAALIALVLVAGGGWLLVQKSTRPIERSIEHMRRFMADAAHELRTPITVLRSRAEVTLQQPRDAASYTAALDNIAAESRRLGAIVDDLLTLARADAGERKIERQRIYLDDLALDAAGAARAVALSKGVSLDVEDFEEAAVEGDSALLRQLLMIVLDNAVKFTPSGGRVTVNVRQTEGRVVAMVSDTGIGIAGDQLPRIFDRFYRVDPARTRDRYPAVTAQGAGLGLAIAKWIADAHDASIAVDSNVGRGTRVTITFAPAHPVTAAPQPAPVLSSS